ncbi:MAG: hypothetical protein FAF03_00650 [Epsilonproteobacteria bacterium]|nr:hypothetical protein [Campylobacterota bacterium]
MKRIYIALMLLSISVNADCTNTPAGMELAKSIEAHEIPKATKLLVQYKEDIKNYLADCDQSKEKFEETSVMIHTYEVRLEDAKYDMNKADHGTDCSKVPSSEALEKAFKTTDAVKIKALNKEYRTESHNYIEHCASHEEYETVYEASMMCDEEYEAWSKK